MLTTTDFIFSYLRLKVMGEYYTLLEGHVFERMTQVASTGCPLLRPRTVSRYMR